MSQSWYAADARRRTAPPLRGAPRTFHARPRGYAPTPLVEVPELAAELAASGSSHPGDRGARSVAQSGMPGMPGMGGGQAKGKQRPPQRKKGKSGNRKPSKFGSKRR